MLTEVFGSTGVLFARQRGRLDLARDARVLVSDFLFEIKSCPSLSARCCRGTIGLLKRHKVNLIGASRSTSPGDFELTWLSRRGPRRYAGTRSGETRGHSRKLGQQVPRQAIPEAALHHVRSNSSSILDRRLTYAYCSPTGSNPTGATAPLERRERVLALVRKYKLVLLEDDAYHYLSFDPEHIVPSYFELEGRDGGEVGRVIRFDSFSKILSSGAPPRIPRIARAWLTRELYVRSLGMRLGFVTGPKPILEIIDLHTANTNLQPS